jgi:hypothetical protein
MSKSRVYSILFNSTLLAGAAGGCGFRINNFNRTSKVKSLIFDMRIENVTTGQQIPAEMNEVVRYRLDVISNPNTQTFTQVFEDYFEVNVHAIGNGNSITFMRPREVKLDSFHIRNELRFSFVISNVDLLNEIAYVGTVIVEIEDVEST